MGRALGGRTEARPARSVNDTWIAACCQAADVTLDRAAALLGTLASGCRVDSISHRPDRRGYDAPVLDRRRLTNKRRYVNPQLRRLGLLRRLTRYTF